jgi:hypothetical protein
MMGDHHDAMMMMTNDDENSGRTGVLDPSLFKCYNKKFRNDLCPHIK